MTIVFMLNTTLNLSLRGCSVSASEALPRLFTQRKESSFRSIVARTILSTTNHAELATQPPSRASAAPANQAKPKQVRIFNKWSFRGEQAGFPLLAQQVPVCAVEESQRDPQFIERSGLEASDA
jgi:hypothetical protein